MLDIHPPHTAAHSWRDFFIHIATIVVGLLIAVALEQTVEAVHRHHEAAALREDLRAESEQVLSDARRTEAAQIYEMKWLEKRIEQVQAVVWQGQPLAQEDRDELPYFASPDIPIWRSAKTAGLTPLLTKGEVNAYAEVEYVQTHADSMADELRKSATSLRSFNEKFPLLPNGNRDYSKASREEMQTYLGLLTADASCVRNYFHWVQLIDGAEVAVQGGKTRLEDIFLSERMATGNSRSVTAAQSNQAK